MGGASSSTSTSEQSAEAYLAQQYYGSCNITCTNIQQGVNIDIINTVLGGSINLTQNCSVDANCLISSTSDASSDVLFKAWNSTNAKDVGGLLSGSLFNFDQANSSSRQDIKQKITQSTTETCKLASLNQMTDISILAANSVIGGSINIGQTGSTQGTCQLSNNMSAAATATAMASNTAQSGKDKKGEFGGTIVLILVGVAIVAIGFVVAKIYTSSRDQGELDSKVKLADEAKAFAGCTGGKAVIDKTTGKPVIDPRTGHIVCKPSVLDNFSFGAQNEGSNIGVTPVKSPKLAGVSKVTKGASSPLKASPKSIKV